MKLLVLGATGATGKHVVEQALRAGHEVRVLVRDPLKVIASDPKLTVVKGDVTAAADIEKVVAGVDAVISVLGPRAKTDPVCAKAAAATIEAMNKASVKRVVWLSAGGVGDSRTAINNSSFVFGRIILPLLLAKPYANHLAAEEAMRASNLDWTVLRPLQLVDTSTGSPVKTQLGDGKVAGLKIARSDLATFIIDEAANPKHLRAMPLVFA
jgi:putative NADH-flavin reductase